MNEPYIIEAIVDYFNSRGYKVTTSSEAVDIIAIKDNKKWVVEAKGEWVNEMGYALYAVIGQIIRNMHSFSKDISYGIAISKTHFRYFHWWGVEGLKLLPIHLFLIDEKGSIEVFNPEEFIALIEELKEDKVSQFTYNVNRHGGE